MNLYALSGLINGIATSILGCFVFLKNRKGIINKTFGIFTISMGVWSYSYFLWMIAGNETAALFWSRALMVGAIFIPASYLHFVFALLNIHKEKKLTILFCYIFSFLFFILNFSPLMVRNVTSIMYFRYWPEAGSIYSVFLLFFFICAIYSIYLLFKSFRRAVGVTRNQLKYIFIGTLLGYLGGSTNYPLWFHIKIPPLGNSLITVYVLIVAYAIVTYRLMDINVAITKGTVFAVVYTFILGFPVAVGFWGGTYLSDKIGPKWWLVPVGMALVLATLAPTIYGFIRRKAEAALFAKRQRYQENLIALGKQMTLTKDLRSLLVLIIRNVTREIGISHARIYLIDNKTNEYVREVHYGKERRRQYGDSLYKGAPLVRLLSRRRDSGPILREEVIGHFETNEPEHLGEIKAQLRSMGAAVLLPAFIGEELVAFLVLGTKRSKEIYTLDDLGMFKILAGQAGLAIENAQFYQELKEAQATMLQAAKLSSIGELAAGFAHQIDNPLGVISLGCQLCTQDIKEWLSRMGLPEGDKKVLQEMEDRMKKVIDTAHRAADLVQRIRGYAKPADKDFEQVDLNSVMEDALSLAQYQISHGGINVNKDIAQDLPKIKGIGVQLEQVFLNMIINACEAMAGKKGELTISARVGKDEPHMVEVIIADNGCGIPEENLTKMFDLFYTTKGSQGTGVGLSMAYRIIKDHGGDINVESEGGKGTRFTVSLPIWKEKSG